ncbi:MAG: metal ABC transporter permease [Candidatus Thermoplasmatota archaeon]|nr:metal ABC transporter permease [Candidatus Thermoplasmatota archaeon]
MNSLFGLFEHIFVQRMFLAGLLASISCGVIGSFIVVKRVVFLSGGIAHATFGGIGLAYYLQYTMSWMWIDPLLGALLFAVATAGIISLPVVKSRLREDSTIGVLWVMGMALGVLFLHQVDRNVILVQDPVSILFGNILLIRSFDLVLMGTLVIAIVAISVFFFKDLQILTFDEEFARISGINVALLNFLLLLLVAFTTVVLIKVVGVVLVIAMLTIPASISGLFTKDLKHMMMLAVGIGSIMSIIGLLLSLWYNLPPGSTIVLSLGILFIFTLLGKYAVGPSFFKETNYLE